MRKDMPRSPEYLRIVFPRGGMVVWEGVAYDEVRICQPASGIPYVELRPSFRSKTSPPTIRLPEDVVIDYHEAV